MMTDFRIERLSKANDRERLPISLVAISPDRNALVGSANVVATTRTHKHLTPWLSSVFVSAEQRGKAIASAPRRFGSSPPWLRDDLRLHAAAVVARTA